jgi:hypothetical protein
MFDLLKRWIKGNPSADWVGTGCAVTVDVLRGEVIRQPMGSPMESFRALGKADDFYASSESAGLTYLKQGVKIGFEQGQLVDVLVEFIHPSYREQPGAWQAFSGTILADGRPIAVRGGETEAEIVALLGEPESRDDDEDETVMVYRRGNVVCEFEVDKPAGLMAINVWLDDSPAE